jgi:hypothetical protein
LAKPLILEYLKMTELVTVEYRGRVNTRAGWRSVYFKAVAEKISEKRVKIVQVLELDDTPPRSNTPCTGTNRQKYNGQYFANQQVGKIKNISTLWSISE